MTLQQYLDELRLYLTATLRGICQHPDSVKLHKDLTPKYILVEASLHPADDNAIRGSSVYVALQAVFGRHGAVHRSNQGQPFPVRFMLHGIGSAIAARSLKPWIGNETPVEEMTFEMEAESQE